MRRVLLWSAAALLLLVAAAIGAVLLVDLSSYRAVVEAQAEAALGRSVTIAGDLDIKASMTPTLAVTQVAVANVPGGSREEMARIGRLEIGLELLPLFRGMVRVTHIAVVDADIVLETGADGRGNWLFDSDAIGAEADETSQDADNTASVPFIGRLELRNTTISHTASDGRTRSLEIKNAMLVTASEHDPVWIDIDGVIEGQPVLIAATTGSLEALASGAEGWPVEARAEIVGSRVTVEGTIDNPAALAAFTVNVEAEIESVLPLAGLLGARPPRVPALEARGTVDGNRDEIRLTGFSVTFGDSDISGDLTIAPSATPPVVTGAIRSERLVVAELWPGPEEPASLGREGPAEAGSTDALDPLDRPLPVDALAAVNLDIGLSAGEIVLSDSTTGDFEAAVRLEDRRLTVSIPSAELSQGSLTANATLNARQHPPSASLELTTERFNLGGLLRDLKVSDALTIRMDAALNLDSAGETPDAMLAGLNGDVVVEADEGDVNARFAGLFGQSLLTAVLPIGDDDTVKIHCAVGHFVIADGVARSTALGVDTQRATIGGDGGADLRARTLDFLFTPQTKDPNLVPLVAPVRIHGDFADPQVTVMTREVLGSVVTSTLLVALVPYAIVLPFIPGISDDPENCQEALYQKLTAPSQSVPERIVDGAAGVVGGAAKGAAGLVGGVVEGVGDAAAGVGGALGNVGRGVGNALGGLFGGGDEPPAPADD